ncbi:hypothetical protein [Psychrobacter sp. JCM 18901]|uniref:hypothetical protein n=1 Tax=Psychrobacter sp. JCM 18901 TaxID=1298609 RepID=UPI0021C351B5|nr:hypothetical protein [Psychrobacter sp. JCM 18901]
MSLRSVFSRLLSSRSRSRLSDSRGLESCGLERRGLESADLKREISKTAHQIANSQSLHGASVL